MPDTKISALPAATTLEDSDKIALAQTLATTPATNGPTLAEVKSYVHTSSETPSLADCTVSTAGSGTNHYATFAAAIAAGVKSIRQTGGTTEAGVVMLSGNLTIYVDAGVTNDALTSQWDLDGYGLIVIGASRNKSVWRYTPTLSGNKFIIDTSAMATGSVLFESMNWQNTASIVDTSFYNAGKVTAINCTFIAGNAENAGLNVINSTSYLDNILIGGSSTSSTKALVVQAGTIASAMIDNSSSGVTGIMVEVSQNVNVQELNVIGSTLVEIDTASSIGRIQQDAAGLASLTVSNSFLSFGVLNIDTLTIAALSTDISFSGGYVSTLALDAGGTNSNISFNGVNFISAFTSYGENIRYSNCYFGGILTTDTSSTGIIDACSASISAVLGGDYILGANDQTNISYAWVPVTAYSANWTSTAEVRYFDGGTMVAMRGRFTSASAANADPCGNFPAGYLPDGGFSKAVVANIAAAIDIVDIGTSGGIFGMTPVANIGDFIYLDITYPALP